MNRKAMSLQPLDIIDNLPGIVWVKDFQLNYYACNKRLISYAGIKNSDNIVGRDDYYMPWAKYAEHYREGDLPILNGKSITFLHPMQFASGEEALILTRKTPLKNSFNNIVGVLGVVTPLPGSKGLKIINKLGILDRSIRGHRNTQVQYILTDDFQDFDLSKRETVCLFYLIRGKTAKEIGFILGISKRTAEKHLESIRTKFNCESKSQVISKAIDMGFVDFLPNDSFIEEVIDDI